MSIKVLKKKKEKGEKITLLTCYDFWSAQILKETELDAILVGDSLAMVMYGNETTLPATMQMMSLHTKAVSKALQGTQKLVISDLPFLSYRKGHYDSMKNVEVLMRSGAEALKLEGVKGNEKLIQHIVESGVPVMGHLGLIPQSIHQLGGHHVQGREEDSSAKAIFEQAKVLEDLGCFAVVLECVPSSLSAKITSQISIPTIGIGAGPKTDGQILVLHDLLGLNKDFKPRFLRRYLSGFESIKKAIKEYDKDVKEGRFPTLKESYD